MRLLTQKHGVKKPEVSERLVRYIDDINHLVCSEDCPDWALHTYSYVKPYLIQAVRRRESVIVTDPKGELYEDTSQYFVDSGYIVRRFDLKNLALSDGWDILSEVRGDPDRAQILAETIWRNLEDDETKGIFKDGPVTLLKALLLRVALDDKMAQLGTQNIGEAYQLIQNPGGEDFLDQEFDPTTLDEKTQACVEPYMSFKQSSPNLRGNMITSLATRMGIFQSKLVRMITSTNDIDLTLPGKKPCAYYCMMSDQHSTYAPLSALFFSFLFQDLVEYADNRPERKCDVPVNFVMDEFSNIGKIPDFDKKLSTIRSRSLNVTIILQDLPQLKNHYPKTFMSIMSNCATFLGIGFNDPETSKYFSDRSGEATIQVRTDQHEAVDSAFKVGNKHSTGEGKRMIFTQTELQTFGDNECLIIWQGLYAMRAYKYPYVIHPEASRMTKVRANNYPPITDTLSRQALRDAEADRIAAFEAKRANGWSPLDYFGAVTEDTSEDGMDTGIPKSEQLRQWAAIVLHYGRMAAKYIRYLIDGIRFGSGQDDSSEGREKSNPDTSYRDFDVPFMDEEFTVEDCTPAEPLCLSMPVSSSDTDFNENAQYNSGEGNEAAESEREARDDEPHQDMSKQEDTSTALDESDSGDCIETAAAEPQAEIEPEDIASPQAPESYRLADADIFTASGSEAIDTAVKEVIARFGYPSNKLNASELIREQRQAQEMQYKKFM